MSNLMAKIIEFWASEAHRLDSVWVHVYRDSSNQPIYHSSCQVQDLENGTVTSEVMKCGS